MLSHNIMKGSKTKMTEEQMTQLTTLLTEKLTEISGKINDYTDLLVSIDYFLKLFGLFVFIAIIFYGCAKFIWLFAEPIFRDF